MKNKRIFTLLFLTVLIISIFSPFSTAHVLAGENPPPTEEPGATLIPTPVPTEEPVVVTEPDSISTPEADSTPAEILQSIPESVEVVILDQNGDAISLATEQAVQVIMAGDPQWCPDGATPGNDLGLCTSPYSGLNALYADLNTNPAYTGSGTIYIANDYVYSSSTDNTLSITLGKTDGNNLSDLVFQGGWDFNPLSPTYNQSVGTSTIDFGATSNNFAVYDWGGVGGDNLILRDIIINGGSGLFIGDSVSSTTSDVTLENVTVSFTTDGTSIATLGNVSIDGGAYNSNTVGTGLKIVSSGNITLNNNVTANGNGNVTASGAYLNNTGGSGTINVDTGQFNSNGFRGLEAYSNNTITLNNVSANSNTGRNTNLSTPDDVTVTGGNFSSSSGGSNLVINANDILIDGATADGSPGYGFRLTATGNITLINVAASSNAGGGARLDNTTGSGNITLSGTNIFTTDGFNLPQSYGLYVVSNGNVDLTGVTATGNAYVDGGGAYVATNGSISITDGNFSNNCVTFCDNSIIASLNFGIFASGAGVVTLNRVTANGNGDPINGLQGAGAIIINTGNIFITNGIFNDNCNSAGSCIGTGISVTSSSGGNVYFNQVTANNNGNGSPTGVGAAIQTDGNIDVYCSTFNNNSALGLSVNTSGGSTITLNGVTLSSNGIGDINLSGGTLVVNSFDCNPAGIGKKKLASLSLNLNIVKTMSSESVELDCTGFSGTQMVLPNGDYVIFPCPLRDEGKLDMITSDSLPGELPDGNIFDSGFILHLIKDGKNQASSDPAILVSFSVPEKIKGTDLTILFWDGDKWIEVAGQLTADGYFQALVNFTGTFVLVSRE